MKTLKRLLVLSLAFSQAGTSWAELTRIGAAGAVMGKVEAVSQGAAVGRVVQSGKPLFLNDHVTSGKDSRLQVMLLDQTVFTLGPNSDMVLDEFVYDPATGAGKVTASITKGVFRFVTGKIAKKTPEQMKVKLPTATIGIRGTIVVGAVDGDHAVVGLGGPGFSNNTGDRYGSIDVSNDHGSADISRPGYGTIIDAGKPPSAPAPLPNEVLDQINAGLTPAPPKSGGSDQGAGGGTRQTDGQASASNDAGQTAAAANDSASSSSEQTSLGQALNNTSTQANQDSSAGNASGVTDFSQFAQLASVPGSAQYSASGAFNQTACSSGPCTITGTWNFSMTVNFAASTVSGTAGISTPGPGSISDSASLSRSLPGSGPATFSTTSGSGGTYNFTFLNGGGQPAQSVKATAAYDNGTNVGSGAVLTAPLTPFGGG